MRSSGKRSRQVLLWYAAVGVVLLLALPSRTSLASSDSDRLEVKSEAGGDIRAAARILFPAKLEVIYAMLTDYAHWPDLFEVRMRVAGLTLRDGIATTDLRIHHALLPGERRLITESRTFPDGRIVTDLVGGGDFKKYHRVWKLAPVNGGTHTFAEFELVVAIDSIVPNWLVALATKQELEAHFRIVKEKAFERAQREK